MAPELKRGRKRRKKKVNVTIQSTIRTVRNEWHIALNIDIMGIIVICWLVVSQAAVNKLTCKTVQISLLLRTRGFVMKYCFEDADRGESTSLLVQELIRFFVFYIEIFEMLFTYNSYIFVTGFADFVTRSFIYFYETKCDL